LIRSPVAQFLTAGLLALVVIVVGTGRLSRQAAAEEAIDGARATTQVLARSVAEPAVPRGLVKEEASAIDKMDRTVLRRLLVDNVQRIKIWDAGGTILYSDETRLIGQVFPLGADELTVLRHGGSDAAVSDLTAPENRFERGMGGLVEVYTRIHSPEGTPLLFEAYYSTSLLAARQQVVLAAFQPITVGALLVLVVVATPLLWMLTRRLERASRERERLLRAAVDASDAERRRIARDLHDSVVQDLAGTSFALSAMGREPGPQPVDPVRVDAMTASLRRSLRSLRSLLVEIYPPDLDSDGLAAALEDLVAPATGAGVQPTVSVRDTESVPPELVALVWRVAQEAVRNTLRHAQATTLRIDVTGSDGVLRLVVSDDGVGFDPRASGRRGHFGLRGMQDLIAEAGGRLDVRSEAGDGVTVLLEVDYR
jgi:signal transduction histidine kinase